MSALTIALVGNPNAGKTSLFNALTGGRQWVGNWPGVTVERKDGEFRHDGQVVSLVDLPGVYSLEAAADAAEDERIARDYVAAGQADAIIDIVDASNLERNLHLTAQLVEMGLPVVVALNMVDVAERRGQRFDAAKLSRALGCPVVPIVAAKGLNVEKLAAEAVAVARAARRPEGTIPHHPAFATAVAALAARVPAAGPRRPAARWVAARLLADDGGGADRPPTITLAEIESARATVKAETGEDLDLLATEAWFEFAGRAAAVAREATAAAARTWTERVDKVVLNRALGIPVFLGVVYLMFLITVNFASAFIDFFDLFVGALLVDGVKAALGAVGAPDWLVTLLADCVGGGVQTVSTFIPVVAMLYLILSILEDSGYMARAAFIMDRLMRAIGLPGKSFVPLIVGFGCNVPAVMAARTMNRQADRVQTAMMAPFMSCGARLPVYALFAAAFFPVGGQNVVFALYLIGIGVAVLTGFALRRTLLRGEAAPYLMELPPYHLPVAANVLRRTWDRLKGFVLRAGRVIVAMVVILGFFNSLGTDGTFGNENSDRSVLASVGKALTPVFAPMGISEENWPATVGLFTGIFAKEAVVGTLDSLYKSADAAATGEPGAAGDGEEEPFDLLAALGEALATIPANLIDMAGSFADPLGLDIGDVSDTAAAAEAQGVDESTIGAMAARFDGAIGAFAYLLAVLLYMPCVAAVAAIHREVGGRWAVFASLWTTGMGYGAAVLAYQIGTFASHPATSAAWIGGVLAAFAGALLLMRRAGGNGSAQAAARPATATAGGCCP